MTSGRAYLVTMVALVAFGVACIALGSGAGAGVGWLTIAAVPGVVATRTWGRRVIGALVCAVAAVGVVMSESVLQGIVCAVIVIVGAVILWVGPRWPTMGSRYERARPEQSAWQALDAGEDPSLRDG